MKFICASVVNFVLLCAFLYVFSAQIIEQPFQVPANTTASKTNPTEQTTANGSNINVVTKNLSLQMASPSATFTDTTQGDFQSGVSTNLDLTSSPGNAILSNVSIDQQNTVIRNAFAFTSTSWGGQTFIPSVTGKMVQADLDLFCAGCSGTPPDITVSIRATTGTPAVPTGADLATATITGFNNGAGGYFSAVFTSPPTLTAGTAYALVFRPVTNPSAEDFTHTFAAALQIPIRMRMDSGLLRLTAVRTGRQIQTQAGAISALKFI